MTNIDFPTLSKKSLYKNNIVFLYPLIILTLSSEQASIRQGKICAITLCSLHIWYSYFLTEAFIKWIMVVLLHNWNKGGLSYIKIASAVIAISARESTYYREKHNLTSIFLISLNFSNTSFIYDGKNKYSLVDHENLQRRYLNLHGYYNR